MISNFDGDWSKLDTNYATTPKDSQGTPLWAYMANKSGGGGDQPMYAGGSPNFDESTGMYNGATPGMKRTAPTYGGLQDMFTQGPAEVSYGQDATSSMGMPNPTNSWNQMSSPYTPKMGKWIDYSGATEGDRWSQQPQGIWGMDPNVDYGQAPEPGMSPYFDQQGRMAGWTSNQDVGNGSGLFGNFGDGGNFTTYSIDPMTGQMSGPQGGSVTKSRNSMTNLMSYAMPIAMASGMGYGAANGAFSGLGAMGGETAALGGSEAALGGLGGVEPIAGSGFSMGSGGATAFGQPFSAGATMAGAGEAGGSLMGLSNLAGVGGGASAGMGQLNQITDLVSKGMSIQDAVKAVGAMGGGQAGGGAQQPRTTSQGGGGMGGIADLLAAYYSSQQMKDYSGNLKGMYDDLKRRQDQFMNPLLQSYQDPNSFYGSNQWKGLESVYKNQVDRQAAKGGTLANPTAREVTLQAQAMKELENYRNGLRQSAGLTNPAAALDPLAKGYQAEAFANTAPFAAIGRGGSGSGQNIVNTVNDTWKTITDVGSTAQDIWKFIEGWFD
jgi:hypothetical protein